MEDKTGITAYHGSPHEFDKFDISKIGTGEGAQAFGHGLYFAEAEPVAQGYRDALTDPEQVPLHFEGKPLDTPWNNEIRERWPHHFEGKSEAHQDAMEELLGNLSQVRELDQVKNVLASVNPRAKSLYHTLVSKHITKPDIGKGSMYEVTINAHPDHFLDWDVPFRNQSEHVQNSLRALGFDPEKDWTHSSLRGNNIYNRLVMRGSNFEKLGVNSEARKADEADASKILSNVGIKGIKYLDAASRGKGEGSRNYVVFDHNDVDIKRRYEQGGMVKREAFGFGGETEFAGSRPERGSTGSAAAGRSEPSEHETVNAFTRGETERGGDRGGNRDVSFPGSSGGGGGQDIIRQQMESAFPTKISGFGGAPAIGMPQSLKELQGFKPQQDEQDQTNQPQDFFAKTIKQATFLPSVGTTTFDQTVGGLPSGPFAPDISKYSMINPASAPKADPMSLSGIDPATGAKVIAGMQGTQPDRPFGSAAQLMQSAAGQQQPIATSPDTSDIFASYFQEPSKQPVQVAQAQQPSPSVDYNVKFDPVTQGFVRTSEPQQPGPITQIAMAAPPSRPFTPTPSTAYQPAPLAQAAGTPTMGYEPQTQLAQAATGLTYTPQVNASFTLPARPITTTPQAQPQQLAQAATGLTYTPTTTAVPMPMPRPTEVAATAPASEQDALVLPGRKTFQPPTTTMLPTPRPSDLPQPNFISDIIDPIKAQMAFAEGQRINDLEAMGKTATYPDYSTPSDLEAASRRYAQDIGLNPNDPADMAKVKARIIQQDGQDRVDYYTKTIPEAIFGTGEPATQGQFGQTTASDRTGTRRRLVKKLMPDGTYQDVYEEYATGGKVKSYPLARVTKNRLKQMSPDQFLSRAKPLKKTDEDRAKINNFKKSIKKGQKLDALALYPNNQENGRHRATAAKELGIKKVPVHDYRKRDGGAIVKHALMVISKKA